MKKKFETDNELFNAIMRNEEQAKEEFHATIIRPLYGYAYKLSKNKEEAADIANYAFGKSLASGVPFDDLKHLTCYMYNAVWFACRHYRRKRTIAPYNVPLENIEETIAGEQQIEDDFIRAEYLKAVYAQINSLPKTSDRRIMLLTMAGETPVEIAEGTGKSAKYVRRRIKILAEIVRNELINKNIITVLLLWLVIK